jgi:hypothetical protein
MIKIYDKYLIIYIINYTRSQLKCSALILTSLFSQFLCNVPIRKIFKYFYFKEITSSVGTIGIFLYIFDFIAKFIKLYKK